MTSTQSAWGRIRAQVALAFAVKTPQTPLEERDRDLLTRVAAYLVRRRLQVPAVMLLESVRPLRSVGSQAMIFVMPLATMVWDQQEYERLVRLLERQDGVDLLLGAISDMEESKSG